MSNNDFLNYMQMYSFLRPHYPALGSVLKDWLDKRGITEENFAFAYLSRDVADNVVHIFACDGSKQRHHKLSMNLWVIISEEV